MPGELKVAEVIEECVKGEKDGQETQQHQHLRDCPRKQPIRDTD